MGLGGGGFRGEIYLGNLAYSTISLLLRLSLYRRISLLSVNSSWPGAMSLLTYYTELGWLLAALLCFIWCSQFGRDSK